MKCVWRWCDKQLDEPVENVFCKASHAKKWVKLHNRDKRAANHMLQELKGDIW